jgi:glutamate-ammonia-ligase adenylyltransferase
MVSAIISFDRLKLPSPFDPDRAARTFESLAETGIVVDGDDRLLLAAAFGNSPYLGRVAKREPSLVPQILGEGPAAVVESMRERALSSAKSPDAASAMATLRSAKRGAALAIALADIWELWDVDQVTRTLSEFADDCVRGALRFLLWEAAARSGLSETDGKALEQSTGVIVLAMGKYGAFELNYSSDIDLIVFYEPRRFPFRKRDDARGAAVDIARGLVRLLSEITSDGYVFRTDLRLRPDAGATQVAISTDAAEAYYENMGQNWERAAMIKSRACAGDSEASAAFLAALEPFVWRRHLDYAAIEDIHSIKRQIHAFGGHRSIVVAGHNIKLGRGGIREIEFFAQTQQLILGGRKRALRQRGTIDALDALCGQGLISRETASDLQHSYRFLRKLEHRLQMIEDDQTHTLPRTDNGIEHISCFMGFRTADDFRSALTGRLQAVQGHYAHLFEKAPELVNEGGNLVFTGVEDDPDTLATLAEMGFRDPHHVANAVRGWHHGRIRATRSQRARELLTRLMPVLLARLAETADPDAAFMQFDRFLSNLPAGVQLFSLLLARGELLALIARIMGSAPRLARHLSRSPVTLDALLDADFLHELPTREALDRSLAAAIVAATGYEDMLDAVRRFAREQMFRVGVQVIEGTANAEAAGPAFANIAESIIQSLAPVVEDQLAASVGRVPGGAFAVIAMGKLGGREMTAGSDLDLIFVYDCPEGVETSDGAKALPLIVYYARFAQRLIAALTSPTAAGELYDVDMRLRPSGNKGPAAVSLESFSRYHERESWTWEQMALTRARVVAASDELRARVDRVIGSTLALPRSRAKVNADARAMRQKLASQFSAGGGWDLKFAPGGLVDIEFIAQTLQLGDARLRQTNTIAAVEVLGGAGALSREDAVVLIGAARLQHSLTQVLRIAVEGAFQPENATSGLRSLLARAGDAADFAELERRLAHLQGKVRAIFDKTIA